MTSSVVVGVDVGGTKIAAATVGRDGSMGPVATLPTPAQDGPDAILDAIAAAAHEAADGRTLCAVGIGTAGSVDAATGRIVESTEVLRDWKGTLVATGIRSRLGIGRVEVRNDVDAHALGEGWLGAGRGVESFLMVAVGTGVGGALVLDGGLRTGAHHLGGEVAHIPAVGAEGLRCSCGRLGHLESLACGPGIHRRWLALGGDPATRTGADVAALATTGDSLAQQAIRDSATCLGRTLAGLVTVVDPDRVVVGGGAATPGLWWDAMEQAFHAELIDALAGTEIVPAQLGPTAAIVGAARTVLPSPPTSPVPPSPVLQGVLP